MQLVGRGFRAGSGYRYGFNGKELDKEATSTTTYDYGFRIYSPALGRFLSVDPLTKAYPMLTPYQFASNRPVDGIDLDGLEYLSFKTSMYRLGYMTETAIKETNNGKTLVMTTARSVINTVYENIPDLLKDPKTQSFLFVSGGPVSDLGRDYTESELTKMIYNSDRYFVTGKFYGLADGTQDPEPTASTRGMGGRSVNSARHNTANALIGALGEEGAGVVKNGFNIKWRKALNKEGDLRKGFYSATKDVYHLIQNVKGWAEAVPDENSQNNLINFLTDGYLPTDVTDRFTGPEYSQMRRDAYESQLTTAYLGVQIISQLAPRGVKLSSETKGNIAELLNKYKNEGGKTDFSDLQQIIK